MLIKSMISQTCSNWNLIEADSGDEALALNADSVNFFSIDLNMPGMDGFELIKNLRVHFPTAKFALMTANVQDAIRQRCVEHDIRFINKPITEESIAAMLEYFNG